MSKLSQCFFEVVSKLSQTKKCIEVVFKVVSNLIVGEEVAVCREMATTTKSRRVFRDIATGS